MIDRSNEKRMISTRGMSTDSGGRALGSPDTETKRCRPRSGSSERGYQIVTLIKVPDERDPEDSKHPRKFTFRINRRDMREIYFRTRGSRIPFLEGNTDSLADGRDRSYRVTAKIEPRMDTN